MPDRVIIVIGTRPECIKLAPVLAALRKRPDRFAVSVLHSGQHGEIVDKIAADLGVTFDLRMRQLAPGLGIAAMTTTLLTGFAAEFQAMKPDYVIVQGDTTTAFAAAQAASYAQVRIVHVEAGLRSGDKSSPFPEEINRRQIGALADFHFAPTERAVAALLHEGIPRNQIFKIGNTIVDALRLQRQRLTGAEANHLVSPDIRALGAGTAPLILATCHRRENLGVGIEAICQALRRIAGLFPTHRLLVPLHPNPKLRETMLPILASVPNIRLSEPLSYLDLLYILSNCSLVMTDSGGLQEEAPSFGVHVLVLRRTTERPEAIEAGLAELVGLDQDFIVERAIARLQGGDGERSAVGPNPFGDGYAAERLVDILAAEPVR